MTYYYYCLAFVAMILITSVGRTGRTGRTTGALTGQPLYL